MKEEKGKGSQLSEELKRLRKRVAELEQAETERKKAEERLSEANNRLHILQQVTALVHTSLDPQEVFNQITGTIVNSMGFTTAVILTLDSTRQRYRVRSFSSSKQFLTGINKILGFPLQDLTFPAVRVFDGAGEIASSGELVVVKHLAEIAHPPLDKITCQALEKLGGSKSFILVPLVEEKELIGGILITSTREQVFPDELNMLQVFARAASQAIVNANLYLQTSQTKEALRESEELIHTVLSNAPVVMWALDKEGIFTLSEGLGLNALGLRPGEVVGQSVFDVYRDVPKILEDNRRALSGESFVSVVEVGKLVFESHYSPIRDENGEVTGMIGVSADITERKQAEEGLKNSEERLKILFKYAPDAYYLSDLKGNFIDGNKAAEDLLGCEKKELIGKSFLKLNLLSAKEMPKAVKALAKNIQGKGTGPDEFILNRKGGSQVPIEIRTYPVKIKDKTVVLGIARDISERKRAEEVLRQKTEQQEVLLSSIPAFVYFKDTELKLITANRAFAEMVNTPVDQLPGKDAYDLFPKEQAEKFHSDDKKVMESGKPMMNIEEKFTDAEGKTGWASTSKVPYFDERGEVVGMVGITIDITERKRAEDEVRKAREYAENIIATVREPLLVLDSGLRVISASRSFYEAFKVIPEETEEQFLYDLGNRQWDIPKLRELLEEILLKNTTVENYEMEHNFETIGQRTMLLNARKVREEEELILLAIEDVTERKKAEEALKDSEERYRGLFENSSEFLFTLDLRGNFTNVNKAAAKLTGHTKAVLLKMNFKDYTPRNNHRNLFRAFYNVFKTGKPLKDFSVKAIIEDKTVKYFEISVSPLKKGDEIIGFQGTSKDITERKRAEEELRQSLERLQKTLEGTVHALASAVEMRDPYTAGHQRRVTELACAVAEEMGLSEEQIEGLRMAGLIHDIGKINVPAEILSKPTHLTDIEFDLMKIHPQTGYDILKGIEFPWSVAQIVLQHHERLDGSGYPTGLKGDEILLEPRILGVADVVEAVSSHRPYRPARGLEKALEEIAQNKGKLYDSKVVDACLQLFAEDRFHFEE